MKVTEQTASKTIREDSKDSQLSFTIKIGDDSSIKNINGFYSKQEISIGSLNINNKSEAEINAFLDEVKLKIKEAIALAKQ